MKKEIKLVKRAMELAMLISTETTTDAWLEYSGHVNVIGARYSPGGWRSWVKGDATNTNSETIVCSSLASVKVLQYIVDCFEFIYAVAERKNGTA